MLGLQCLTQWFLHPLELSPDKTSREIAGIHSITQADEQEVLWVLHGTYLPDQRPQEHTTLSPPSPETEAVLCKQASVVGTPERPPDLALMMHVPNLDAKYVKEYSPGSGSGRFIKLWRRDGPIKRKADGSSAESQTHERRYYKCQMP